jgi:hypothetical protein
MAKVVDVDVRDAALSEDAPGLGTVECWGVSLTEAERWVEDGEWVIRSREFDVLGAGATFEDALERFGDNIIDFAVYLAELDDLGENEEEMLHALGPRVLRLAQKIKEHEQVQRRKPVRVQLNLARRKRDHNVSQWQPLSRPPQSSAPSLV